MLPMNAFLYGVVRAAAESLDLSGPVLEVGSFQVSGQEGVANLRTLFPGRHYTGIDIRTGPGVDRVCSVERLPFADGTFSTVLAMNTFEHVARFWRGFEEIFRVLRPDGIFLVSCPFYFHIHNHPCDYWRFTPEALDLLLEAYPQCILGWQGDAKRPLHVWAIACRRDDTLTAADVERYHASLRRYARQPLPRLTRWRYALGRLLCGRRPFVPYLAQNRWEIACRPALLPAAGGHSKPTTSAATFGALAGRR